MNAEEPTSPWPRLAAIVALALAIRLWVVSLAPGITADGFYYATLGRALVQGNLAEGMSAYWPPLYPLLVGLAGFVFGDLITAGKAVSVVCGALLPIPGFLLMRPVWDTRVALIGALVLAIYPQLVIRSADLLAETTYTLLLLLGVWASMEALFRGRRGLCFWAGALFGAAYLSRPEGFIYVLMLGVLGPTVYFLRGGRNPREVLRSGLLLLVGFGSLAGPYAFYLKQELGHWTVSAKMGAHLLGTAENWHRLIPGEDLTLADKIYAGKRPETPRNTPEASTDRGVGSPREAIVRTVGRLTAQYHQHLPEVFPPLVLMLAGAGLFLVGRGGERRLLEETVLLCFVGGTLLAYGLSRVSPRYLAPVVPLTLGWVAAGLVAVAGRIRSGPWPRIGLVVVLLLSLLPPLTFPLRSTTVRHGREARQAGEWLREHGGRGAVLLSGNPSFALYAEAADFYYEPDEDVATVLDYARRREASFWIVDETKSDWKRGLQPLLEATEVPPGLELVYRSDDLRGARLRIYRVLAAEEPG